MPTNSDTSFQIVKSSKGINKLSNDGYLYIFHRGAIKKEYSGSRLIRTPRSQDSPHITDCPDYLM